MDVPRRLRPGDETALAGALARAFRDNPLNRAVVRGDAKRRLRANRAGMRATLSVAPAHCSIWGIGRSDGAIVGGLIAVPPGVWPLPPPPVLEQLLVLARQGLPTARRWGEVYDALRDVHPAEPSWYLALVGVGPDAQGQGLGRALLGRFVREIDADHTAAYLETDRPELLPFYAGFGFRSVRSLDLFGVTVHCLWRPVPGRGSPRASR